MHHTSGCGQFWSTTSDVPDLASSSPKRYATSSESESTRIALLTPRHREFARPHQTVERGTRRPRNPPRRGEIWTNDAGASVLVISSTVYNEIATEPTVRR